MNVSVIDGGYGFMQRGKLPERADIQYTQVKKEFEKNILDGYATRNFERGSKAP